MKSHPDPWNIGADTHQHSQASHESIAHSPISTGHLREPPKPFHTASDHNIDAHSTRYTPHHHAAANDAGMPYHDTPNTYTYNCWK